MIKSTVKGSFAPSTITSNLGFDNAQKTSYEINTVNSKKQAITTPHSPTILANYDDAPIANPRVLNLI